MNIKCKKVILHNFGSYKHTEVDLCKRGCCAVIGENHCPKDSAKSNGAGKTMLWSAICYALTGETVSGLTTNLHNVNVEDDQICYVLLEFDVDLDHYKIIRHHTPKSALQIFKNNIELSGKGIRESNKILAEHLPDLTKDLVASCLIIGQGMPNKFSSFSPSGRKDLLEKLTKSDYMLDDTKERLTNRQSELNKQLRVIDDAMLVNKTNTGNIDAGIENTRTELSNLKTEDYDSEINNTTERLKSLNEELDKLTGNITKAEQDLTDVTDRGATLNKAQQTAITQENNDYAHRIIEPRNAQSKAIAERMGLTNIISQLTNTIKKMQSVRDVCPTCGQKLPGVIKPDTSEQETELAKKQDELKATIELITQYEQQLKDADLEHTKLVSKINSEHAAELNFLGSEIKRLKAFLNTEKPKVQILTSKILTAKTELSKLQYAKENYEKTYKELTAYLEGLLSKQAELLAASTNLIKERVDIEAHLQVLRKIETLIKRDFRGYLLTGIIDYLDKRAKEYSQIVFGTDELNIYLNGNNLNISYCNKMLDNLSGGERQRVDLILQFSIRDMLSTYLNYSSNILVLDEVFDGLDSVSTSKILELISTKLKDIESVFIISHHSDTLNIGYDSELKVIKDENGISEVY